MFSRKKKEKTKQTNIERYGVENVLSSGSQVRYDMEFDLFDRYGVYNVRQIPSVISYIIEKSLETKYQLGLAVRPELKTDWQLYKRKAINLTNKAYRKNSSIINSEGIIRGRNKYHLDHKVSIRYGFDNNIPIEIISHISNLCMLEESKNISKSSECSITIEQLYSRIVEYEYLKNNKNHKD